MGTKYKLMLGVYDLCAGRGLYRATPAVTSAFAVSSLEAP